MNYKSPVSVLYVLLVRLRFILVFVVIGLIVGNWEWITNVVDRYTRPHGHEGAVQRELEWFCPMHPSVVRDEDAKCPICGMPLSRRKRGEKPKLPAGVIARLELTPQRIEQAGLATEEVMPRKLVREVRTVGFIRYDERRITDLSARVAGRVDELHVNFTGSRVEKGAPLYRIYSPDLVNTQEEYLLNLRALEESWARQPVDKDAAGRAARLVEASRERLRRWGITDEQVAELDRSRRVQTHLTIHSPVAGVVWKKDIHAGHYVEVGEEPFTVVDDAVVWVEIRVFEPDLALVKEGQAVELASEAYPGEPFPGKVSYIQPELDPETRTARVRADVENAKGRLRPEMYVTARIRIPLGKAQEDPGEKPLDVQAAATGPASIFVCEMHQEEAFLKPGECAKCGGMVLEEHKLPAGAKLVYSCPDHPDVIADKPGKCPRDQKDLQYRVITREEMLGGVLAVPVSAVIDSGSRKVVFLERGAGVFEAVEVTVSARAGEYYPVIKGLSTGDKVVVGGAFLLDAEARLNPSAGAVYFGASGHEGHK